MKAKKISFNTITIGQTASFSRMVTENDVQTFADLSGDYNPLHVDKKYAKKTEFKHRIVHGMFVGGLVSQLIGMKLPGEKALLVKECLEFKKPVYIGDTISIRGTVLRKSPALRLLEIRIDVSRDGKSVVTGIVHAKMLK